MLANQLTASGFGGKLKNSLANKAFRRRSLWVLCFTLVVGESLFSAVCVLKVGYAFICKVFQVHGAILSPFGRKESSSRSFVYAGQSITRELPLINMVLRQRSKHRGHNGTLSALCVKSVTHYLKLFLVEGAKVGLKKRSEPCLVMGTLCPSGVSKVFGFLEERFTSNPDLKSLPTETTQ